MNLCHRFTSTTDDQEAAQRAAAHRFLDDVRQGKPANRRAIDAALRITGDLADGRRFDHPAPARAFGGAA